jgi:hypothetical protein
MDTLVLAVAAAAVVGLVWWIRRVNARHREKVRIRIDGVRTVVEAAGFTQAGPADLPPDMPDWAVATPIARASVLAGGSRQAATMVVFDHTTSGPPALGYNNEVTGTDDKSETSRHTVICLRHDGRALPRFELVPNLSRMPDAVVDTAAAAASLGTGLPPEGLPGRGLLLGMARLYASRHERPGALSVGRETLEAAYRVYGADAGVVAASLTDAIEQLALEHPGLILAADGQWLAVSRNVRMAPDGPADGLPSGLLSPPQVEQLVQVALELGRQLDETKAPT